jgi:RNA polymerase sigma factor (sigma-70 family)
MTPPDDELWRAWIAGDQRAGAKLVERHYSCVDRFFRYKLGEHQGVDLTQATFLAVQESRGSFRGDSGFRTWLFGIARNKLLYYLRNQGRDQQRIDPDASSIADLLDPSLTERLDAVQSNRLLLAALRRMPLDVQVMLELHYWEGMKVAEIAEVVNKPVNTIKTQMRRGRQRLEKLMDELKRSVGELESTLSGLEGWAKRVRQECEDVVDA